MSKFEQNIALDGIDDKQFLVIAFEAILYLGWRIKFTSDAGVIAYTENGVHAWNGEITVKLEDDFATVQCMTISNIVNDYGHSERAVQQFVAAFENLKTSFTEDETEQKYEVYEQDFLPAYEDTLKPDTRPKFHFFNGVLSYFKPADGYFVTPILIWLNILIFVAMLCTGMSVFEPDIDSMILWGANSTVYTLNGQWWRLISSCFLHFGIIHLLLNMYALFYVGFLLEPFLGKAKFLTAYLLAGITGSLASLWWHDSTVSAGASGAIFGLYGVFLAILSTNHVERSMRNGLLANIGVFVVYNLIYGGFKGGTDNAAHIGGLLGGGLIGYLFIPGLRKPDNKRLNLVLLSGITIITIVCSSIFYTRMMHSDKFVYQKRMEDFYAIETKAVASLKDGSNREQLLIELNDGIGYWKSGITLIKELDKLDLSKDIYERNKLLFKYCLLRIQSYQSMYNSTLRNESLDDAQLQKINQQIKSVLDELKAN